MSGGFQVVLRLGDPFVRDDSGFVRFGHTGPSPHTRHIRQMEELATWEEIGPVIPGGISFFVGVEAGAGGGVERED